MMAQLGSNPSYVWRSLLAAREVIREGSIWQVGDGKTIGVNSYKWLPNTPVFLREHDVELKVCDLINQNTRQWDWGKIFATFTPRTCAKILATPLDHLDSQDVLVWKESKDRKFSVKTAYQVAIWLKSWGMVEHSMAQVYGNTWSKIWKLKVPPKVRTFLWRACSNCLPTRDNLC